MVCMAAAETKAVAASASDCGYRVQKRQGGDVSFYDVFAVWRRAPSEMYIVVHIGAIEKVSISI